MSNYLIEGNIDFYSELYNSLDINEEDNNDENVCLITNEPLGDKFIMMECGHKFNYLPLFLDIKNHKQKFNLMEGSSSKLNMNQIRCPYCRKIQLGNLPYYEEMELGKIVGVNYINSLYNKKQPYCYQYKYCEFLYPNSNYIENGMNPIEISFDKTDNCKFFQCTHKYATQLNSEVLVVNEEDKKYYCWSHKKQMIKKYKKEALEKQKEEAKKEKLK